MSRLFIALSLLFFVLPSHALEEWHIGWLPTITSPDFTDPDGPVQQENTTTWQSIVVTKDLERDARFVIQGFMQDWQLNATNTELGQKVERSGGFISYQGFFRVTRSWKPWFGVGVGYIQESYRTRYTVLPSGYLQRAYPDRDETGPALILNATVAEWDFVGPTTIAIHLQYERPFRDHMVSAMSGGVMIRY